MGLSCFSNFKHLGLVIHFKMSGKRVKAVSGHLAKMSRELLMHPLLSFATEAKI